MNIETYNSCGFVLVLMARVGRWVRLIHSINIRLTEFVCKVDGDDWGEFFFSARPMKIL